MNEKTKEPYTVKDKVLILPAVDEFGKPFDVKLIIPLCQIVEGEIMRGDTHPIAVEVKPMKEQVVERTIKPEAVISTGIIPTGKNVDAVFQCPKCAKGLGTPEKTWQMTSPRPTPEGKLRKMTIGLFHCCGKAIRQVIKTDLIEQPKTAPAEPKVSKVSKNTETSKTPKVVKTKTAKSSPKKRGRKSRIELSPIAVK